MNIPRLLSLLSGLAIADIGDVRSEGLSYGMMLAVQLDRKAEFDRLCQWTVTHLRHADGLLYFLGLLEAGGRFQIIAPIEK